MLEVFSLPVLQDNYIFLGRESRSGLVFVVDPAEATTVQHFLEQHQLTLNLILNTHHHADHTGGNLELAQRYQAPIVAASYDKNRIPGASRWVSDGDYLNVGATQCEVLFTPGHTSGHICFWFAEDEVLFAGDTLFSLGCGRLFEGSPLQMWDSLCRIRELPDTTTIYCAHEYTEANAAFALSLQPEDDELLQQVEIIRKQRQQMRPTIPTKLGYEKHYNPFLRADDPKLQTAIQMSTATSEAVFTEIRHRKDNF